MNLSICVDAVFAGQDMETAVRTVKREGFGAIEFWSWKDKDLEQLMKLKKEADLEIAAFCTGFISLVDAGERGTYLESLKETIGIAKELGCKTIISQVGAELDLPREEQRRSLIEGLKASVPYLEEAGMTLVIEPLNVRVDHAGYFLSKSDEAADVIREVGREQVKMLYDIYHQQISEGDILRRLREYLPIIGHIHAAGNPGRHELYRSELSYRTIFDEIRAMGYEGYIGLEYFPQDDVSKGLSYARGLMQEVEDGNQKKNF